MALSALNLLQKRLAPSFTLLLSRTVAPDLSRGTVSVPHVFNDASRGEGRLTNSGEEDGEGVYEKNLSNRATQEGLVNKFYEDSNLPAAALKQKSLRNIRGEFARFPGDVGSSEVQIASLTKKVEQLAEHLSVHKKDHHSRRGLTMMLNKRRKLLEYLRETKFDVFAATLSKLGLKDNYAPRDRFSKYDTLKTMKARQAEAKLKHKQKKRR